MVTRSIITGCGSYLPQRIVTNDELSQHVDTSDSWIVERTGIRQRHIAAEGEKTSDLAIAAARQALAAAGEKASDIDLIVLATCTPDETFPATATRVQSELGANKAAAFDVGAVCSGFIFALATADNFIRLGQAKTALVIGAETMSRMLDWNDRATCVLFGDGAGAVVLRAEDNPGTSKDRGILSTHLHSDGRQHDMLFADGGPSGTGTVGKLRMRGRDVFRHAVANLSAVLTETLQANHLQASDIDWLVPHQANKRILDATAQKLGLPLERIVITVDHHANTSAASVPLALAEACQDGRIKPGDLVMLEAMGAGFTWAAGAIRW